MDSQGRGLWQVAGGLKERAYIDTLLEWDVIVIGPGDEGRWPQCKDPIQSYAPGMIPVLRRFCEEMQRGDLVVLRLGTDQAYGVGEVADSGPMWLDDFGDIDGWALQIVRRVRWLWKYDGHKRQFPTYTLKFGPTVLRLDSTEVIEWLNSLEVPREARTRDLARLPESCRDGEPIELAKPESIAECLYDRGIPGQSVAGLLSRIDELVRVARWYQRARVDVKEQETVAYLALPLLQCLGWSPQTMALQSDYMDGSSLNPART